MNQIEKLVGQREAQFQLLESLIANAEDENRDFSDAEAANERSISAEIERLTKRIDSLKAIEARRSADAELTIRSGNVARTLDIAEGEIYRDNGENSFFTDVVRAQVRNDRDAQYRLDAHNEMARASVSTDLGGLVLPKYELGLLAKYTSEGRPTAGIMTSRPLTSRTVSIAQQTSDTHVETQASEGLAPTYSSEFKTTELTFNAATIHGYAVTSVQALDFGSLDDAGIRDDLFRTYNEQVNYQVLHGSGVNGDVKGILTAVSPENRTTVDTAKELWDLVADAKTEIYKAVNAGATHVIMTPDIWQIIESQTDNDGRPVFGWNNSAPSNVTGQGRTWAGLNVVVDSQLYSASAHATPVWSTHLIVAKANEGLLYEQGPKAITLDTNHARNGQVEFVIRGYAAFTCERRDGAFQVYKVANPS